MPAMLAVGLAAHLNDPLWWEGRNAEYSLCYPALYSPDSIHPDFSGHLGACSQ
eukprot:SAG11_NODE_10053_length_860_cov_2.342970_2_plen_52_part_01